MTKPKETIDVNILGHEYTITFPDNGKLIDISVLKAKLADNHFTDLRMQITLETGWSVQVIDAFAHFTHLIPDLKNDLKVKSLFNLPLEQSIVLVAIFTDVVTPWLNEWFTYISEQLAAVREDLAPSAEEQRESLV